MEKKKAWIYSHIDAPEDVQGLLEKQYKTLYDYAHRMGFEVAGDTDDIGYNVLWERDGFNKFMSAMKEGQADVLLVSDMAVLSQSQAHLEMLKKLIAPYRIDVYSLASGQPLAYFSESFDSRNA